MVVTLLDCHMASSILSLRPDGLKIILREFVGVPKIQGKERKRRDFDVAIPRR